MATEKLLSPQELRMVLLGGRYSGKTTVINAFLGLETQTGKRSAHSLKNEGEVSGRKVVLVNTHGWWRNFQVIDSAGFIKQELVLSVCLCPPGPHAFILTVMIDLPFTEENRRAMEQHLGLFGENIWKHTIVVFTRGECLKGKSIEQHIESEGEALKWLVEKCGNRYCVFDKQTEGEKQVIQLLDKIEEVAVSNSGRHFELDEKTLRKAVEKKKEVKVRAKARFTKMGKHREQLKEQAQVHSMSEIRILLLGWVSSRKTSAKNTILNKEEAVTRRTMSADVQTGEVDGLKVSVVDTPGWWKYFPAQSTPGWVKRELQRSLSLGSKAPHAILLAVPVDTTFPEEQRKITEDNMKMFGEQVWRHTVVLFTCGDLMGETTIEEHIESEGEALRWLVEKCGNRYHVLNNINRGDGSQVTELLEKIKEMVAGNSSYASDTQLFEVKETTEEPKGLDVEMGNLLDEKWNRMDEKMEEKIINLWTQSVDQNIKGNKSTDKLINFKANEPSKTTHREYPSPAKSDTLSCALKSGHKKHLAGEEVQTLSGQSSEVHSDLLEKVKGTLEREWGIRETVVMERAWGMMLEMSSSRDLTSEPDEHEFEQARIKVCNWRTKSSGLGSDLQEEDISF